MANQALYRKWRPQVWDDVVCQDQVTHVLRNAIKTGRVGHAYLFSGPRGTGKTTVARLLARAVNCLDDKLEERPCDKCANCIAVNNGQFLDLIEIDAASNTSVDDIRDLRDKINFAPSLGRMKVYIIDEVHMLSTAAFNALLKTLEEPPAHAMFILATTEIHKIPATVLSRCQHHEFRRLPVVEIERQLEKICQGEDVKFEKDALTLIARQSTGAMRDAISMLDQLSSTGEEITLKSAQDILGIATNQAVMDLTQSMIERNTIAGLDALHTALDSGTDPRQLARQAVEYLRQLLILHMGTNESLEITNEARTVMAQQCQQIELDRLVDMIRIFNQAAVDSRVDWHPGLNLELAFAECCEEKKSSEQQVVKIIEKQVIQQVSNAPQKEVVDEEEENEAYLRDRVFIRKGSTPDPSVSMQEIKSKWNEVRGLIKEHDVVMDATLNHAKLIDVREGVLYLGFPRETIKRKVEENHRFLLWTAAAISNILGKSVGVCCTILNSRQERISSSDASEAVEAALQLGGKLVVNKK